MVTLLQDVKCDPHIGAAACLVQRIGRNKDKVLQVVKPFQMNFNDTISTGS